MGKPHHKRSSQLMQLRLKILKDGVFKIEKFTNTGNTFENKNRNITQRKKRATEKRKFLREQKFGFLFIALAKKILISISLLSLCRIFFFHRKCPVLRRFGVKRDLSAGKKKQEICPFFHKNRTFGALSHLDNASIIS